MVDIYFNEEFEKTFRKISHISLKKRVCKQIEKISLHPLVGKPMRAARKGTREVYVKPFRLSYVYYECRDLIVVLSLYHKDDQ